MTTITKDSLLISKPQAKQKTKMKNAKKQAMKADVRSFSGTSIYDHKKRTKIDSHKLKDAFLSNLSFAGTNNTVAFGSGGDRR